MGGGPPLNQLHTQKEQGYKHMKKLLMTALLLSSVIAVAACSSTGETPADETLTQAPYAQDRTVGNAPVPVTSAEPVFQSKQVK